MLDICGGDGWSKLARFPGSRPPRRALPDHNHMATATLPDANVGCGCARRRPLGPGRMALLRQRCASTAPVARQHG
jgi:hypothetical protein